MTRLEQIEKRLKAVAEQAKTWRVVDALDEYGKPMGYSKAVTNLVVDWLDPEEAEFIVHAPADIAFLLDVAKAAQAALPFVGCFCRGCWNSGCDGAEDGCQCTCHSYSCPERDALRALLPKEGPIDRVLQEGEEREA